MPGPGFFDDDYWGGDEYFDTYFDDAAPGEPPPVLSGNGGVSKSKILGVTAPRPQVPPWRQISGPEGIQLTEIRNFLAQVHERDDAWGNRVTVTFTAADTPVRVLTGLGGPAKGYRVERADADVRVWDATPPAEEKERGVLWLQASGPAKIILLVY